jgi:uncharacterized protein (UPF0332 family)
MKGRQMDLIKARDHLELAQKQLDSAQTDSWEPAEPESCVTYVFYAYENAIVAVSEALGIKWKKNHYEKAELAAQFAKEGKLSKDISDLMRRLNDLRKDVSYGEAGVDLLDEDLEALVTDLELMIDEVEGIISNLEDHAEEDGGG